MPSVRSTVHSLSEAATDLALKAAVRAALIGGSLANGSLFWVRAALGQNQLTMHECSPDGEISIGGVSEQLYGEGFLAAWHDVLARELPPAKLEAVLYEVGRRGARWEVEKAIEKGVWVPVLLKPLVGRPELLAKVKTSAFTHAILKESLLIMYRMINTEGGWGVVRDIELLSDPIRVIAYNTPEPRRGKPCHLLTGIVTGYFETLMGVPAQGRETTCRARGSDVCTFEIEVGAPAAAPAPTAEAALAFAPSDRAPEKGADRTEKHAPPPSPKRASSAAGAEK